MTRIQPDRPPTSRTVTLGLHQEGFRHSGNVDASDLETLADALAVGALVTYGVLNVVVLDSPTDASGSPIEPNEQANASIWVRDGDRAEFPILAEPEPCYFL